MFPIFLVGLCAFLFSLVLTPICRNLFRRLGIVDRPDNQRKLHTQPVPHMGGVPICLAYLASCVLLLTLLPGTAFPHFPRILQALPAGLIIFATGALDDSIHLKPWQKLCGQLAGALWAYWAGVRISSIAGHDVGWASLLITIIWLIGCTNAFNLIDGVDGLASGVGLFATVTMLIAALFQNNMVLAMTTAPLAGALLGFLRYNFNPASIFLGDSGSLVVGFLLGCFGVLWSQKSATILGMTAPLMALVIPILDTGLSIVRRFLRHQPIFGGDRNHIHHRLLDRGLTPRTVALVMYGAAGIGAVLSLLQSVAGNQMAGVVIVLFCAATWMGIQHLGYTEFSTARRMLLSGTFQRTLDAQLRLRSFEQELAAAKSVEECWGHILETSRTFDFVEVKLCLADTVYQQNLRDISGKPCWSLHVPLPGTNYINFMRPHDSAAFSMVVAPFMDVVRKTMSAKCQQFGLDRSPRAVVAGAHLD
jgi:UDP-GlcNAc:undecaprenyl-phosphate GlcNAc-1-phosphate transferase